MQQHRTRARTMGVEERSAAPRDRPTIGRQNRVDEWKRIWQKPAAEKKPNQWTSGTSGGALPGHQQPAKAANRATGAPF